MKKFIPIFTIALSGCASNDIARNDLAVAQQRGTPTRLAQPRGTPTRLGDFQNWTAVAHSENGQKVCYAFTRARSLEGVQGRTANDVMLLVTHRRGDRDQVAVRPGYSFASGAQARLFVGQTQLPIFTAQDNAFARDGRAAVQAMRAGHEAISRGPGPDNRGQYSAVFSLLGFPQAYDTISRECPEVPENAAPGQQEATAATNADLQRAIEMARADAERERRDRQSNRLIELGLGLAAGANRPPAPRSNDGIRTYNVNGRSFTCTTSGPFTNCF